MRVLLAGATGVIGVRLVERLVAADHEVLGLTRRPDAAAALHSLGATGTVCNVYDSTALTRLAVDFAPDAVVHQLTDLADDPAHIDDAANARIRTTGTANLLAAADAAAASHFLAQSVAWTLAGVGGEAVAWHEEAVLARGGVVVRYGQFYGPGTYFPEEPPTHPRIHVDSAAARTVSLLTAPSGVVTLVDAS